jgi:hypothetical protein
MDNLQTTRGDTYNFTLNIVSDNSTALSGFTAFIAIDFFTGVTIVQGTEIINGSTTFIISSDINDVEPRAYDCEVYITDGTVKETIKTIESYSIEPSIIH